MDIDKFAQSCLEQTSHISKNRILHNENANQNSENKVATVNIMRPIRHVVTVICNSSIKF
jgi:hypothetical protein